MLQRTQDTAGERALATRLLAGADRCVKCGLCQPHCPTYALSRSEADSPRGRIALIEGLASGRLALTGKLDGHLDGCLLCRRCERACPSGVQFGQLMDDARRLTLARRPAWLRWTVALLSRPGAIGPLLRLGRHAPPLGERLGQFARLARAADRQRPPAAGVYPALGAQQGRVGLFLGCVGRHTHAGTLHAALRLLRQAGFEVLIPAGQGCCGALHAHLGDAAQAAQLAGALHRRFDLGLDAIVSVATGCGAHLQDAEEHRGLPAPHADILSWLAAHGLERLRWRALAARVAVHTPCSQRNALRSEAAVTALLGRIPGLQLQDLPGNDRCCGAAGSYLLSHADTAAALRAPKLAAIAAQAPDWVVTSNPGCALHLIDGLRGAARAVPVVHPIELLAAQLVND